MSASTDTILSHNSSYVAQQMGVFVAEMTRTSSLFLFLSSLMLGFCLISIASSFQKRELSSYVPIFLIYTFLVSPSGDGLVFNKIVSSMENVIDGTFTLLDEKLASRFNDKLKMPPGYYKNILEKAFNAKVDNSLVKDMLNESIVNCIPAGKTYNGKQITARDLFEVNTIGGTNSADGVTFNFDQNLLKTRQIMSYSTGQPVLSNCYDVVTGSIFALRKRLKKQIQVEDMANFSADENISSLIKKIDNQTKGSQERIVAENTSLNIATINAAKDYVYKKNNPSASRNSLVNGYGSMEVGDQVRDSALGSVGVIAKTSWHGVKRSFHIDGYGEISDKLSDILEKQNSLPYMIVSVKNILNFLAVIALAALLVNFPIVMTMWIFAYVGIILVPHLFFFTRLYSNYSINSFLHLSDPVVLAEYSANKLIQSVSLTAMAQAKNDLSVAIREQVNTEYWIFGGVMSLLPMLGFMAHKSTSSVIGRSMQQAGVSHATHSTISKVSSSLLGADSVKAPDIAPPVAEAVGMEVGGAIAGGPIGLAAGGISIAGDQIASSLGGGQSQATHNKWSDNEASIDDIIM